MKEEFEFRGFSCDFVDRLLPARNRSTKSHETALKNCAKSIKRHYTGVGLLSRILKSSTFI